MRNNKILKLFILLFAFYIMMWNFVHAWHPFDGKHKKSISSSEKKVKPILPKPITSSNPDTIMWDNLNDGFLIPPGKTFITFPIDPKRVVIEVSVNCTASGKTAQAFLLFGKEKDSNLDPIDVKNTITQYWHPTRRDKCFRIEAKGNTIRLFSVRVKYRDIGKIDYEFEEGPVPTPDKLQVFDYIGIPITVKANSYSPYFKLKKSLPVEEIIIDWQAIPKAKGYMLYDKEKPTPDKMIEIKDYVYNELSPKKKIKKFRIYAEDNSILIHNIIVVYE